MKMKVLLALTLVVATRVPASAVQRTLLIEDFTNYQCPPCEAIEDSMNSVFAQKLAEAKIAPLRYHVNWPAANDTMWEADSAQIRQKIISYAVNYVPSFRYDGSMKLDPSDYPDYASYYADVWSTIDERYNTPAAVSIDINDLYRDASNSTVRCNFDVTYAEAVEDVGANQRVYMAVIETSHNYIWGKEWYIFRGFADSGPNGAPIAFANVGESYSFQWQFPIVGDENPNKLNVLIWVQKTGASWPLRNVLNAAYAPVSQQATDVPPAGGATRFELSQNVPNPFNPMTSIRYSLDRLGAVKLSVFDPSGRLVTELVNASQPAGAHEVLWNGLDRSGKPAASGVYYYRLESPTKSQTRKMTLIK